MYICTCSYLMMDYIDYIERMQRGKGRNSILIKNGSQQKCLDVFVELNFIQQDTFLPHKYIYKTYLANINIPALTNIFGSPNLIYLPVKNMVNTRIIFVYLLGF